MDKLLNYLFFIIEKIVWLFQPIKSTKVPEMDSYLNSEKNSIRLFILSIFLMLIESLFSTKDDANGYGLLIANQLINYIKLGLNFLSLIAMVGCLYFAMRWLYLRWKLGIND